MKNIVKLAEFDAAVKNLRDAVLAGETSVSLTTTLNHGSNTLNISIDGQNIPNTWQQRVGVSDDTKTEHVEKLSDELGNLIQDYLPEIEDDTLEELCERIATYSYNFTGSVTAQDIENYIKTEQARAQKRVDEKHKKTLDGFKNRQYNSKVEYVPSQITPQKGEHYDI